MDSATNSAPFTALGTSGNIVCGPAWTRGDGEEAPKAARLPGLIPCKALQAAFPSEPGQAGRGHAGPTSRGQGGGGARVKMRGTWCCVRTFPANLRLFQTSKLT